MVVALFSGSGDHLAYALDAFFGVFPLGFAELAMQLVEIGHFAQTQLGRGTPFGAGRRLLGIDIGPAMAADANLVGKKFHLFTAVTAPFET